MRMLYVKSKILKDEERYNITQNAWLCLFPYIVFYPTELEEGKFRKIAGFTIEWLHWSITFRFE